MGEEHKTSPLEPAEVRFEGLLLDLDGTLVDSERLHYHSTLAVMAAQGLSLSSRAFARYEGWSERAVWIDLARRFGVQGEVDDLARARTEALARLAAPASVRALPGAAALLRRAAALRVPCAVVSSLPRAQIDLLLAAARLGGDDLRRVSGHDDVAAGRGKPAPDPYVRAAESLGVAASRCLAVEDSAPGIASALAAGCRVAAVGLAPARPAAHWRLASLGQVRQLIEENHA